MHVIKLTHEFNRVIVLGRRQRLHNKILIMHGIVSMTIPYYPLIMMTILTLFDINSNTITPCPTFSPFGIDGNKVKTPYFQS
jgi:hypothetical protein